MMYAIAVTKTSRPVDCRRQTGSEIDVARTGSTLTEVLVAILIMGIGIVSVVSLFPLSVLQTVKATQLTHATDLRHNVSALVALNPKLVADPDLDSNYIEHTQVPGIAGQRMPGFEMFVVDPLGYVEVQQLGIGLEGSFGNKGGAAWTYIRRYNFGMGSSERAAQDFVKLPDSWETQWTGVPTNMNGAAGGTRFDATNVLSAGISDPASVSTAPRTRVVFLDATGNNIQTRFVRSITAGAGVDTVSWFNDLNSNGTEDASEGQLPASYVAVEARIETQDTRYTWLLTVRVTSARDASDPLMPNAAKTADIYAVVYFNRPYDAALVDEALYDARFVSGSEYVTVNYAANAPRPNMKAGGFVFDAGSAYWYRILQVIDGATGSSTLRLASGARATSPRDPNVAASSPDSILGKAMFPRGVVDVFPLGTITLP